MLSLILMLVMGSIMAILSLQNTMKVSLSFFEHTVPNIPLFYVIIGSMLLGILLSYILHLAHSISAAMTIRGKNKTIQAESQQLAELTRKFHQLELENARLKKAHDPKGFDDKSL